MSDTDTAAAERKRHELLTTNRKALSINLDERRYGTFAEIGAGQETARVFFQAGGAAGTIAKSISAYDMKFSDEIYGKCGRYVSEQRLMTMLQHEFDLLLQRLDADEGAEKTFFAYANTVKAKGYRGGEDANGWIGLRFQSQPRSEPDEIILHVRMWDPENVQQQHALGILGANLIYGAFYLADQPELLVKSLIDHLGENRVEIDLIRFRGPSFKDIDNRIQNLVLVREGLTRCVLFSPEGEIVQPSEVLYKKALLVERGSFRPVTKVNIDMLASAGSQFVQEPQVQGKDIVVLAEITMNNLLASGELDNRDFLDRVDSLGVTGNYVLISNYFEFYRLVSYFRRYTKEMIGIAMGINNLLEIFNEKYYTDLAGGILENFGRLFRNSVKLYIYPMKQKAYRHYLELRSQDSQGPGSVRPPAPQASDSRGLADEMLITCENLRVENNLAHLYKHLLENGYIEPIKGVDPSLLSIFSRDILNAIASKQPDWEPYVPEKVAAFIKANHLFGYR